MGDSLRDRSKFWALVHELAPWLAVGVLLSVCAVVGFADAKTTAGFPPSPQPSPLKGEGADGQDARPTIKAGEPGMATNPSGVTGRGIPGGPGGAPVSVLEEMTRIYADATEDNVKAIGKAIERLNADPDSSGGQFQLDRARAVERQVMARIARLDAQLKSPLSKGVLESIERGAQETEREARRFGLGADSTEVRGGGSRFGGAVTTGINDRAVELLATDAVAAMAARLNQAARDQMGEGLRLFRAVAAGSELAESEPGINRAIGRALVTGNPRDGVRAMRELFRDPESDAALTYRKLGNRQITVGGWTGSTRAYASTLFRTRSREVSVAAKHERARELGVETFQITGRVSENFCTRFIGVVYTLGSTAGLPDFVISASELPGGPPPFHPNCSKSSVLYILGLAGSTREGHARKAKAAFETARQKGELTMKVA